MQFICHCVNLLDSVNDNSRINGRKKFVQFPNIRNDTERNLVEFENSALKTWEVIRKFLFF